MAVKIMIPTALRRYAGNQAEVEVSGKDTVGAVLEQLVADNGDLKKHLYDDDGKLRSFVNVYVNNEDIRYLKKNETEVKDGDTLMLVPSIAGGR